MIAPPRAIVVGGGVGGLVAAAELAGRGWRVELREAGDRLGGAVRAVEVPDGRGGATPVDVGAESFATRDGTVAALVAELGIADRVVAPAPEPAWVASRFGAAPLPATGVLGIPQDPLAPDVRRVVGLPGALRALADRALPFGPVDPDESIAALVRRRLGARVAERLVAPIAEGVHSRPAERLRVAEVLPELLATRERSLAAAVRRIREDRPAGSAVAGLEGGMTELVAALAARIADRGGRVRLGTAADALALAADADLVVDATPGPAASRSTVVLLVVDAAALDAAPRGPGVLVARGVGVAARGLTHSTAKWPWLRARFAPGRHVIRLSFDGHLPAAAATIATAVGDAERVLGVPLGTPVAAHVQHWEHSGAATASTGVLRVGAAAAGTGLARVVAQARSAAAAEPPARPV